MNEGKTVIGAGVIEFSMRYRQDIPDDPGLSIEVRARVDGHDTEILRFDCFRHAPHYHYGPELENERLMLDATALGDPLAWTLERFERGRLKPMILRAGYPAIADALDEDAIQSVLPRVTDKAREIVAEHTS